MNNLDVPFSSPGLREYTTERRKKQYYTEVWKVYAPGKGNPLAAAMSSRDLWYKHPNDCTVLIVFGHTRQVAEARFRANNHCKLSAVGEMSCWGDYLNRERDATGRGKTLKNIDLGTTPGVIKGFPRMQGPIGSAEHGGYKYDLLLKRLKRDDIEAFGLTNDPGSYNGGKGIGAKPFKALLDEAWQKALDQADAFKKTDCKDCKCEEITVVFLVENPDDAAIIDEAAPGFLDPPDDKNKRGPRVKIHRTPLKRE